ncbi:MAG: ATP-binding protein [Bryobacteraceae bacterium]
MAALVVATGAVVVVLFERAFGGPLSLVVFFLPIMFAGWYGGFGPGVFASCLSTVAIALFLASPATPYSLSHTIEWILLLTFLGVGIGVSWLNEFRRRSEAALRESRLFLDRVLATSPVRHYLFDLSESRITYLTPEIPGVLGFEQQEMNRLETLVRQYTHPDDLQRLRDFIGRLRNLREGEALDLEFRARNKQGQWRWLSTREAAFTRDAEGRTVQVLGTVQDISPRKEAEEGLRVANEALARKIEDLRQFSYLVSHDLKEPLRSITAFAELLLQRESLGPEGREAAGFVLNSSHRMAHLIEDLLRYANLSEREEALERSDIDPAMAIQLVLGNLNAAIRESGASVTCDPLPKVYADFSQLMQVFQNLISNAIKYRSAEPPRIHIRADRSDSLYVFSVADNGVGVPAEYGETIFQPFKRLHGRKYPGTGIGLAICRRIVELHGGRIWVDPAPGGGSVFRFTLPAAERNGNQTAT